MLQKTNISLTTLYFRQFEHQNNVIASDRVLSLHLKKVHFETSFSLAVFSKTTKVEECAELGPCSMDGVSTTTRNKGLISRYRMY